MLRIILFSLFSIASVNAQLNTKDSIKKTDTIHHFRFEKLIVPGFLIGYGVLGLESGQLKAYNTQIKNEIHEDIDKKTTIDDFSRYAPALAVYALNVSGVKGKHNFKDRTIILGTSYLLMSATVLSLKSVTKVERPDGSNFNSFPSGHTATAFAGAEFLWQEYKDVSVWYGISGYLVATGTGFFRIYNDKHWLTDVFAGAGIGILSTKVAYWINPFIQKRIFKRKEAKTVSVMAPFYNGKEFGVGFMRTF